MHSISTKVGRNLRPVLLGVFLASCQNNSPINDNHQSKAVEGYGDLKFGMPFDQVIALTGVDFFSPIGLQGCLRDRAVRGCLVHPKDNLTIYRTIQGVPYGLGLAFNKFDKLTDVELRFTRRVIDSPDQKITDQECLAIYERTADWIVKEYGSFDPPSPENKKLVSNEKTAAGTAYTIYRSSPATFLADNSKVFSNTRGIRVFSFFQPDSCDISVEWQDAKNVERWELSPDEKAKLDRITKDAQ